MARSAENQAQSGRGGSEVDAVERQLRRLQERVERQSKPVVRRSKNGDFSIEYRDVGGPYSGQRTVERGAGGSETPDNPTLLPPSQDLLENGNLVGMSEGCETGELSLGDAVQVAAGEGLGECSERTIAARGDEAAGGLSCHEAQSTGNDADDDNPLEALLQRAMAVARPRMGRPAAFDEQAKGKMIALLALGLSVRQAASVLGVSHTTVSNALKADPALSDEITAARFHAQLQPLACVIRESRRSWKAATWLLKYLDAKIKYREETPEECAARYKRERDEVFGRA